ncbi:hypothetical protein L208DRAFT_1338121, partial [Tricholoma matsutake]
YDVCVVQEPYIDFKGHTQANQNWTAIYPNRHQKHPDRTRSVILINANLLTDAWKQIDFKYPDITVIKIQGEFGTLPIINIYNDREYSLSLP